MDIIAIAKEAVAAGASDILISADSPVMLHVDGVLRPHSNGMLLTEEMASNLIYQFLTMEQRKTLENERELDAGYNIKDFARFRVSVYYQKGSLAAALRLVPLRIPLPSELGFPPDFLARVRNLPNGLVLFTGPTGAGKSTSIASLIELINTEGGVSKHVITIEDPIEFVFKPKQCVIDQREIGRDTFSYVHGLRSALRSLPHVIFVGEMRDRDTIEIALRAAETGNLVISTLATASAAKTINRIVDIFPVEHQSEIRTRLALSLKVVVSQVLLPRVDIAGRIAAREVMFVTNSIANLVREGKIHQIPNVIATAARDGMVLMDDSLASLLSAGAIDAATAMTYAVDLEKIKPALKRR
ncbi:MAG: type IV pilus twitching motility protein PilT [bacterium]